MDLTDAPTSTAEEKSTPLNYVELSEIQIPAGGTPILDRKMRLRRLDIFPGGVDPRPVSGPSARRSSSWVRWYR